MNGFLVLLKYTFHDDPIRLCATHPEAVVMCQSVLHTDRDDGPPRGVGELGPPAIVSRLVGIGIVEFRNGIAQPFEAVVEVGPVKPKAKGGAA